MFYLDLLNPDGSVNQAEFDNILANRISAEINMRRCVEARIHAPRDVPLGLVPVFYAVTAQAMCLPELPTDEVDRIKEQQRDALNHWVSAMVVAAEKQRRAMLVVAA